MSFSPPNVLQERGEEIQENSLNNEKDKGTENKENKTGNENKKEAVTEPNSMFFLLICVHLGHQTTNFDKFSNKNIYFPGKWQTRRRPVLNKRKTISSAGAVFQLAAEKKIELIELQRKVAETELQQQKDEHNLRMEILGIKKEREIHKSNMLKQGNLVFEF